MDLSWAELAQPVVGGLAGILGVYATEHVLGTLRRRGLGPERWTRDRTFLAPAEASPSSPKAG